jgi:hypothetical protein
MTEPQSRPRLAAERHRIPRQRRRAAGEALRLHRRRPEATDRDLAADARALAVQSRRAQGLPDHITDAAALARGAQLVLALRRQSVRPRAGVPP